MLRCREQAIVPIEFMTSDRLCPRKERGGAIRQGSEPGGDPPKPPGAAPPGPKHGSQREELSAESTSGNRSGRPRFPPGRYAQAAALS
jgi:hypothetical protein